MSKIHKKNTFEAKKIIITKQLYLFSKLEVITIEFILIKIMILFLIQMMMNLQTFSSIV
jgi:hypothetical protein